MTAKEYKRRLRKARERGDAAAEARQPRSTNPYLGNEQVAEAWYEGYDGWRPAEYLLEVVKEKP